MLVIFHGKQNLGFTYEAVHMQYKIKTYLFYRETFGDVTAKNMRETYEINTIAPMMICQVAIYV